MAGKSVPVEDADIIIKGKIDGYTAPQAFKKSANEVQDTQLESASLRTNYRDYFKMRRRKNKDVIKDQSDNVRKSIKKRLEELKENFDNLEEILNPAERELLRCVGLDTYCMLRFLKTGLRVSCVSFLMSLITLIPLYASSDFFGRGTVGGSGVPTVGYYSITYNHLERESKKFWVVWFYCLWFSMCEFTNSDNNLNLCA